MIADAVTTRWTGALFNLAKRQGALEEVQRDVERIGVEVASPAVQEFLFSARVSREQRQGKLGALMSSFHPLSLNFVHLLFEKNREEVLRGLADAFKQRLLVERNEVEGVVESARKLDSGEITQLATALGAKLNKTVILSNRINTALMGGVRVFVGANMIDYSVQGRIEDLRRKLFEVPLPATAG